jgi:phosphoglycolate phosphatase-like HAD superfamily hydrolase
VPVLGLPDSITACLFDLDGVLTQTAKVHAAAWKQTFDEYLRQRDGAGFKEFDPVEDYDEYVDGKPRYDGVRALLGARGVELPEGDPSDTPAAETIDGLGNRNNEIVPRLIREQGVQPWAVHETELDLDRLVQTESVFALANGHIGLRGNLDEGEPSGLPGTYLAGV